MTIILQTTVPFPDGVFFIVSSFRSPPRGSAPSPCGGPAGAAPGTGGPLRQPLLPDHLRGGLQRRRHPLPPPPRPGPPSADPEPPPQPPSQRRRCVAPGVWVTPTVGGHTGNGGPSSWDARHPCVGVTLHSAAQMTSVRRPLSAPGPAAPSPSRGTQCICWTPGRSTWTARRTSPAPSTSVSPPRSNAGRASLKSEATPHHGGVQSASALRIDDLESP